MSENPNPNFFAIIIAPVLYSKKLVPNAKLLYGHLTGLSNLKGYSWACNQYLADQLDVEIRAIQKWLRVLEDEGFIQIIHGEEDKIPFRHIYLSNNFQDKAPLHKKTCPPTHKKTCTPAQKDIHNNTYNNTRTNISSLEVSEKEQATCVAEEKIPSSKKKKSKVEHSDQVKQISEAMLNSLKRNNPVYRPPEILDSFLQAVHEMIEIDRQNPELLLKTFEWACGDNEERNNFKGWQSIICVNKRGRKVTNPAEVFKGHFSSIFSQMNSKPKRKFAPCSNDERAIKTLQEGASRAL